MICSCAAGEKGKISTKLYYKYKKTAPHLFGTGPLILHLKVLPCVLADRVVCLLADVVLDLARILLSGLFVHAEGDEKFCERVVAVEHLCCDRHAAVCQRDEAVAVHLDISVFAQALGRVGDAGLRHAQMVGHVDRTDIAVLLFHHQHGFEIIFRCLLDFHVRFHQLHC